MAAKWPREKDLLELLQKASKKVSKAMMEEAADIVLEDENQAGH